MMGVLGNRDYVRLFHKTLLCIYILSIFFCMDEARLRELRTQRMTHDKMSFNVMLHFCPPSDYNLFGFSRFHVDFRVELS